MCTAARTRSTVENASFEYGSESTLAWIRATPPFTIGGDGSPIPWIPLIAWLTACAWSALATTWTGVEVSASGTVALTLGGDVETLRAMATAVGLAAERINLYVDRRTFRPEVVVASLDEQRPGSRVVAALEAIEPPAAEDWSIHELVLVRTRWGASGAAAEVFERVPIGTGSGAALVDGE